MNTIKKKGRRLFWCLVFMVGAVGLFLWVVPEPVPPTDQLETKDAPWSLPGMSDQAGLDRAYKALVSRRPWGASESQKKQAPNAPGVKKQVKWNLCGVIHTDDDYFALIDVDGQVKRYVEGDVLPGGEKLREIGSNHIEIENQNGFHRIRLYDQGS